MRYPFAVVLLLALALIALGLLGKSDFEEAERQAEEYCYHVHKGTWPDFENVYETMCRDGKLKRPE